MKIAFVGGGSLKWTTRLVADMVANESTAAADLVLHDIDEDALNLVGRSCWRINTELGGNLNISTSLDRRASLYDADFVVLCVAVGGLMAVRNDLLIPEKYGIYQSVGDTVGPGGVSRALRHIPFVIKLAREMEELCPEGWLLNLTNPMTTICRSITSVTNVKTIGLCHEVDIFRKKYLAFLLDVPADLITFDVIGINHLPIISNLDIDGQNGVSILQDWLAKHSEFEFVDNHVEGIEDIFFDRLAVKLSLFKKLGILFGAGDRHVAEFFPDFLAEANLHGMSHGVQLTTPDHREELASQIRRDHENFVNGGHMDLMTTDEQVVPAMAALSGGQDGVFIVNVPNDGIVEELPEGAVLECSAKIDESGVHCRFTDELDNKSYGVLASHVDRQELIVEAALSGERDPALEALSTDPLVVDPNIAGLLLTEMLKANEQYMSSEFQGS